MGSASGIHALGDLHPGTHVGQFYADRRDLVETLVPYFAAGLRQNERCMWVTSHPLCADDARTALAAVVPDLAQRERAGQIEIIDHDAWYRRHGDVGLDTVIDGWLRAEEAAIDAGYVGLRISGNASWVPADQWTCFAEYEARVHAAFRGRNILSLCSYSLARCGADEVVDVLRNHTFSLVRGSAGWESVHGATAALASLDTQRGRLLESAEPLRTELAQLVQLHRLTAFLGEVTTRAQLVDVLCSTVMASLEADGMAIIEIGPHGDPVTFMSHGAGASVLPEATRNGMRAVWSNTAGPHPELAAFAATPLVACGQLLGALVLGFSTSRLFSATYRALVEDVSRQVALALDRSSSYERLEHERARAESASRAKDEFLAMLGHELRNPLAPILTATQLMQLRDAGSFQRERTVIERQVKHMIRLVDDLLDVSRITRGKVELRKRAIEIADVVSQAVELVSPAMEERSHLLQIDAPAAGVVVQADPQRLAQVLTNLLANAAKYTPAHGRIHLTVQAHESTVIISVRDSGIGIEPSLLPHVFDLFVQGRQGIDRASGGLGLGLTIAKMLVELHGGSIAVSSEGSGKGSEFIVQLPRYANARPSRNNMSGAFILPMTKPRHVLVVDDNEDAALLFSEALRRLGHKVAVAHDGPSALEVARSNPPEIAFLDIGLPVMDGYELGRRLRELGVTPPRLVAVTGYGHTSDRARSREAGFDLHLVKPNDLAAVQDALIKLGG
ncbi:MAG TPA: MEDS domain-containing protein [Kofleriaceae bacterium]|nr:MEDS domain-containing protein [Kofleriaceae bacterium]